MPNPSKRPITPSGRCATRPPSGFTLTEVVAAAGVLVALMAVFGPLSVRALRVLHTTRHHTFAIDEMSNQLDRLMALQTEERELALSQLQPSSDLLAAIPSATLSADIEQDSHGTRLVIRMNWDRAGDPPPLSLTGWIDTEPAGEPSR